MTPDELKILHIYRHEYLLSDKAFKLYLALVCTPLASLPDIIEAFNGNLAYGRVIIQHLRKKMKTPIKSISNVGYYIPEEERQAAFKKLKKDLPFLEEEYKETIFKFKEKS